MNEEIKKQHINNIRGNRDMQAEKNSVGEEDSLKEDNERWTVKELVPTMKTLDK